MPEPPAPVAYRIWTPLDAISGAPGFDLKSLNTYPLPDGALVYVRAAGVYAQYFLRRGSTAAADDCCVVAPDVGPGRWHRYPEAGGITLPWPGSLDCGPLVDGAYREVLPAGNPFPSSVTWYADDTKAVVLLRESITRAADQSPTTIVWQVYDSVGNLVRTITDALTYANLIETTRTRGVVEA